MVPFCFVIHPLSFEDVVRYEPGAAGKGSRIVAKILEWMPAYAAAHVTGVRTPDGRETEGWFVAAPLLARADARLSARGSVRAHPGRDRVGAALGARGRRARRVHRRRRRRRRDGRRARADPGDDRQLADHRRRRAQRSFAAPTRWAIERAAATAVVVGATGSIGAACVQLIAPRVRTVICVARNETRLRTLVADLRAAGAVRAALHGRPRRRAARGRPGPDRDVVDARRDRARAICARARSCASSRCRTTSAGASPSSAPTCWCSRAATCASRERCAPNACASRAPTSTSRSRPARRWRACRRRWCSRSRTAASPTRWAAASSWPRCARSTRWPRAAGFTLADMRAFDRVIHPSRDRRQRAPPRTPAALRLACKTVVSVSLGSSSRDHRARGRVARASSSTSRAKGWTARSTARSTRLRELDGTVDAIGLGGIDVYLYAGSERYALRDGLRAAATR